MDADAALPTLKCVIAWSDRRNLCDIVGRRLEAEAGGGEVRRVGDDALVVSTSVTAEALRDLVRSELTDDENVIVLEFETWSGYGTALDTTWLLRRGH